MGVSTRYKRHDNRKEISPLILDFQLLCVFANIPTSCNQPTNPLSLSLPHDIKKTQVLRGDQAYDISVHLVVPTSQHNVALGNFMVTVSLLDKYDRLLTSSSRPALLTYESLPVRWMRTLWRAIPLVLLWSKEAQTIKIPVLDRFLENSAHPVTRALIEISTGKLQIYKCTLNVDAHFQGLRYFMHYYRVSTAIVFMSLFIFWEMVFTVLTWQLLNTWFGNSKGSQHHSLTVQDPQLAQTTRLYDQLNDDDEDDSGRSLSFRGTGARPGMTSFSSGRRQGQIPALGPIPRQPQLQEDAYFASESEGSEERLGGTDEDEEVEEEEGEEGHLPHQQRKPGSTIATEALGGRPGSVSARSGPRLEESDEPEDTVVPGIDRPSERLSKVGSATMQDVDVGEGSL